MKSSRLAFLVVIVLPLASNGCGLDATPVATPDLSPPIPTLTSPTPTPIPQGETIIVNTVADSGPGTLRQALLDAQGGDVITFDPAVFPPEASATIYLTSRLPPISQGHLAIDAASAGVILDGSAISDEGANGVEITSDGNIIRGLQIIHFPNAAIALRDGAQNNIIGGERTVGEGPLGQGNLLSGAGSFGVGIWDADTSFNTIVGNFIGTDLNGTSGWGILRDGVHINGATQNMVINNLISGNGHSGVYICCSANGNTISDNYIGTDIGGVNPLGNLQGGITIDQASQNNGIGPNNLVAYNEVGVAIQDPDSSGNTITRNSIHDNQSSGITRPSGVYEPLHPPVIFDHVLDSGILAGAACASCIIEVFSDDGGEGETFEGQTESEATGAFAFNIGHAFVGPQLTVTATDAQGNTSSFSLPTSGASRRLVLQEGNDLPRTQLQTKPSSQLAENRIGDVAEAEHVDERVWSTGVKWMRLILDPFGQWQHVDWERDEYSLDPMEEQVVDDLLSNGVRIMLVLDVWHTDHRVVFYKSEADIQLYLNWVRYMVRHFKGRIEYYEILNEPDLNFEAPSGMPAAAYVNLIERTAPIIREEDPEAKIVAGGLPDTRFDDVRDFMWAVLNSEAMPLVDGFSWHPMYGAAPSDDPRGVRDPGMPQMSSYWENYPALVEEIMSVAGAKGFRGEFFVEEILWRTPTPQPESWGMHESEPYGFTDVSAAKYYARAVIIHLGLDVATGLAVVPEDVRPQSHAVIRALCTAMAGARAEYLPVVIESAATNIQSYGFALPNGDRLFALWTDGAAVEHDPGENATLMFPDLSAQKVIGIEVLNGFEQEMVIEIAAGNLVIRDLLIRDYPIILRLEGVSSPEPLP